MTLMNVFFSLKRYFSLMRITRFLFQNHFIGQAYHTFCFTRINLIECDDHINFDDFAYLSVRSRFVFHFVVTEENVDTIEEKYIYPPPWFISNWTMNDYFIRKDRLKQLDDRYAQKHQQKVLIESNRKIKSNFTILEYTKVSGGPKFCHQTDELTFGKQCPYKNCR